MKNKKEYDRAWYAKNKDRIATKKNKNCNLRRLRNLQFTIDYLRKNPCIDCGESDFMVLEFDHLCCKLDAVSELVRKGYALNKIKEEIKKCEVRCANCHRRKSAKQLGWYKNII